MHLYRLTSRAWPVVVAAIVVAEVWSDAGRITPLAEALRAGDLVAASASLQVLPGELTEEERLAVIHAIDRLSPGADWLPFLESLAEKNSSSGELKFLVARAYWRAGDIDSALQTSEKAISLEPDSTRLLYQAAALAHTVGRVEEAERWLSALLHKEPDHTDGLFLLGRIQASQGDDKAAKSTLLRVLAVEPTHFLAQYELGRLENRAGNSAEAERHLRAAVKAYPFFREAYNSLLVALARLKKTDEIRETQKIVNRLNAWSDTKESRLRYAFLHPDVLSSRDGYELAVELCHVNRDDLAKSYLTGVFDRGTADGRQMLLLAHLRSKERDFQGSLDLLDRIQDSALRESEAFASLRAWSLFFLGRIEECRAYYAEAGPKHKGSSNLQTLAKMLEKASVPSTVPSATAVATVTAPFQFVDATDRSGLGVFKQASRWVITTTTAMTTFIL
jgi:tetratricopeptide (TPR) repeat protein